MDYDGKFTASVARMVEVDSKLKGGMPTKKVVETEDVLPFYRGSDGRIHIVLPMNTVGMSLDDQQAQDLSGILGNGRIQRLREPWSEDDMPCPRCSYKKPEITMTLGNVCTVWCPMCGAISKGGTGLEACMKWINGEVGP